MLKVRWTQPALLDLLEHITYIAKDSPQAARDVAQRIWDATQLIAENPWMGRTGTKKGTREWAVKDTRVLMVYRVREETIELLRLWAGGRDWQNTTA